MSKVFKVKENIFKAIYTFDPQGIESSQVELMPDVQDLQKSGEDSYEVLRAYNLIKRAIWMSSIHKTPEGEPIETNE